MTSGDLTQKTVLLGRVALVTGGSRGIGLAVASALASAGAAVAIMARDSARVLKAVEAVKIAGGRRTIGIPCDVTAENGVRAGIASIEQQLGPVGILVNSAGQSCAIGPIWETDPASWWRDVEVNLRGTFLVTRAVVGRMIECSVRGCVINLSSAAGNIPVPMSSAYACSKAAIQRFTDSLAPTLGTHGISVFAFSPGTVRTEMTERLITSPEVHRWMPEWREIAPDRWTSLDRVGEVAVLLASGRADALSGRFIHVQSDVEGLIRDAQQIRDSDFYSLRLREPQR